MWSPNAKPKPSFRLSKPNIVIPTPGAPGKRSGGIRKNNIAEGDPKQSTIYNLKSTIFNGCN